jgi:hypothetical protein
MVATVTQDYGRRRQPQTRNRDGSVMASTNAYVSFHPGYFTTIGASQNGDILSHCP